MKTDHVVLQHNQFACLHCGQTYTPGLPAPVSLLVVISKTFTNDHAHCKPKQTIEPLIKRFEPGGPL